MTTTTLVPDTPTAKARARLEAVGRKCDGCGTAIGRWTENCYYDTQLDKVYGSACGCSVRLTTAPFCVNCGGKVNPFQTEGVIRIPRAGGFDTYCKSCSEGEELGADDAPVTHKRPKIGMGKPVAVTALPKDVALTDSDRDYVAAGPYKIVERFQGWYNVIMPAPAGGRAFVRHAGGDLERATKKCAQWNKEFDADQLFIH